MRQLYSSLVLLLVLSTAAKASPQVYNFTVSNNTALDFENGTYIIEVIEITKNIYVKVNMTSSSLARVNYLFEFEPVTFGQVKLSSSSITETNAVLKIEFPDGWGYPKIYPIVRPVAPVGSPNIVITRTADKTNINAGDVVSFTIRVENTGNATGYDLMLIEHLPNGFTIAPGSRYPPVMPDKLEVGESQEIYYALKAVDSGTYNIEPAVVKYGTKTSKSNPNTVTVAASVQEKSNLTTAISADKNSVFTEDLVKINVRITNTGKAPAKSVLVEGTPPLGTEVVEGDLRQVYDSIAPGEQKEYRVVLKAIEQGNYSISLRTVFSDNPIGVSSTSEVLTVTRKEKDYLYIIIPTTSVLVGLALFTIKRHREYAY